MKINITACLAICIVLAGISSAKETTYVGTGTGFYDDSSKWNQTDAPTNNAEAKININSGITITLTNSASIGRLALNGGAGAELLIDGGHLATSSNDWNAVGYNNSSSMVLRNGGSMSTVGRLDIGLSDNIDGQINTFTMESDSGNVTIGNVFRIGPGFDGVNGANPVNATAQVFVKGGTLSATGLTIGSVGTTLMDFSGTGSAVINGDIRNNVADYVATSRMTASEDGKLVRATNAGGTTTIQAVTDTADYVRFEGSGTGVAGSGDGIWQNGANWRNQEIGYADGYAAGSNDTVRIKGGQTATLTGTAEIGGLLMGDNEAAPTLIIDGGQLSVIDPNKKGWSSISFNQTSTLEIKNGGVLDFAHAGNVLVGQVDSIDGTLVSVVVEDGLLKTAGSFRMGGNYDGSHTSSVHVVVGSAGTLDVGSLYIDNDNNTLGKGSVWLNLEEGGSLVVDGDQTGQVSTWIGDGRILFNGFSGGTEDVDYTSTVAGGHTTIVAIPEPATIGLITSFGGAVLFIRRMFMV